MRNAIRIRHANGNAEISVDRTVPSQKSTMTSVGAAFGLANLGMLNVMAEIFQVGQTVIVRDGSGRELKRVVAAFSREKAFVCTDTEYNSAKADRRPPGCTGFPIRDVVPFEEERSD